MKNFFLNSKTEASLFGKGPVKEGKAKPDLNSDLKSDLKSDLRSLVLPSISESTLLCSCCSRAIEIRPFLNEGLHPTRL